jgi:hypothetical protein
VLAVIRISSGGVNWYYTVCCALPQENRGSAAAAAARPKGNRAKGGTDPYSPQTVSYKVKNPAYTQAEGRGDLFERRQK